MSSLTLRSVSHRFPGAAAPTLHDVDLDVADGEMVSVVGPSGSGKTTLLRVAAGLESHARGDVLLDGEVVSTLPPEQRDLTVMFQQPHLFTHLDVAGNVAFGPRLAGASRRDARTAAERYLALVHLEGFGRRHPRQLSGGQQQRVALARALAAERGALLLDEPFSSLDPALRTSMHDLLGEVRAALAPTVLMVTHDLDEAALADRAAVLVDGRLEQVAPVADFYRCPATLAVARLVGGFNEIKGTVTAGAHRSAWGFLEVPAHAVADGPATLLVRREDLRLADPTHATGSAGSAGSAGSGGAAGAAGSGLHLPGVVADVRQAGPRQTVIVETRKEGRHPALRIEVELPLGSATRPGERVDVRPAAHARPWVVAADPDARTGAVPSPAAQP